MPLRKQFLWFASRPPEQAVELAVGHREAGAVIEIFQVQSKRPVRLQIDQVIENLRRESRRSVGSEAHHFVLTGIHFEAGVVGKCRIEEAEGVREMDFLDDLQLVTTAERYGSRGPFAYTIHRQDQRVFKWRRIKCAGSVALVVLGKQQPLFPVELLTESLKF